MKITPVRDFGPVKLVRSLYYANRKVDTYRPIREIDYAQEEQNFIVKWFKKFFK